MADSTSVQSRRAAAMAVVRPGLPRFVLGLLVTTHDQTNSGVMAWRRVPFEHAVVIEEVVQSWRFD